MHTTSVSLLERLAQPGDQEAWQRFVRLYTPVLYSWACRAGLQESDTADLVQDVLVVVFRKLSLFQRTGSCSFRKWLRTVMSNKMRDHWKRRAASAVGGGPMPDPALDCPNELEESEYRGTVFSRALR